MDAFNRKVALTFPAGLLELLQHLWTLLKKSREVGQYCHRIGTEVMLDPFNILSLRFRIQADERKEP